MAAVSGPKDRFLRPAAEYAGYVGHVAADPSSFRADEDFTLVRCRWKSLIL